MSRFEPKPVHLIRHSAIGREALRVAEGRPDVMAGLRAALATAVPLVLALLWHKPELTLSSLAGYSAVLCDKGGPYRTRAQSIAVLGVLGSLATFLGSWSAGHLSISVSLVVIGALAAGFARVFGAEAITVSNMTVMALVLASSRPAQSLLDAAVSAGYFTIGSAWGAVLSLALWPLRVHQPARIAIADALLELTQLADAFIAASPLPEAQRARRQRLGRARSAIEVARARLGSLRRGRIGPSRRAEQLLALVEACDLVLGTLVAMDDALSLPSSADQRERRWIERVARHISAEFPRVARALQAELPLLRPERTPREPASPHSPLLPSLIPAVETTEAHMPRVLARAIERVDHLVELARHIDTDDADLTPEMSASVARSEPVSDVPAKLSRLRDHLTLDSAVCRHALRSACATGTTLALVGLFGWNHGYWATLTCFFIMQPHGIQTWTRALQRVIGTLLGVGLASMVASYVVDLRFSVLFVFVCVAVAVSLLPLNYGAFTVFLTPAFLLLAETHHSDSQLAGLRLLNTLLGAAIALLASRLLFPLSERDQLGPLLSATLEQLDQLLGLVAQTPPATTNSVIAQRRKLGLSLQNAEASYQRLLTETGITAEQGEALSTLILYAHRLASGLIALAFAHGTSAHQHLHVRAATLHVALLDLKDALHEHRAPADVPVAENVEPALERVEVLFEQFAVMSAALTRSNGALR